MAMFLRSRHRFRIAFTVIVCLLFQQVAMAAYACPSEQSLSKVTTMAQHCAGTGMDQAQVNPALCEKHCTPDRTLLADHVAPVVPALALPPILFAPMLSQSGSDVALLAAQVPVAASDPPPRLRFCSLLI